MLTFTGKRIFLIPGATDMRKSFNGLSGIARELLGATPSSLDLTSQQADLLAQLLVLLPQPPIDPVQSIVLRIAFNKPGAQMLDLDHGRERLRRHARKMTNCLV